MGFGIAAGNAMRSFIQTSAKSEQASQTLLRDLGENIIKARVEDHKAVSHGWVGGALALTAGGLALLHAPIATPVLAFIGAKTAGLSILSGGLLGTTALGKAAATAAAANAATAIVGPSTIATTTAAVTANTALGTLITGIGAWGAGIGSAISNVVGLGFKGHSNALLRPVEDLTQHTAQVAAQKLTQEAAQEGGEVIANQAGKGANNWLLPAGAGAGAAMVLNPFGGGKES